MNFLKSLCGKKIRRICWDSELYLYEGQDNCLHWQDGTTYYGNTKAFLADDWEIIKEKKTLSDKVFDDSPEYHSIRKLYVIDVKEAIEKFIDWLFEEKNKLRVDKDRIETMEKAKEIFGEKLMSRTEIRRRIADEVDN